MNWSREYGHLWSRQGLGERWDYLEEKAMEY